MALGETGGRGRQTSCEEEERRELFEEFVQCKCCRNGSTSSDCRYVVDSSFFLVFPPLFLMVGGDKSTKFICGERSSTGDAAVN